MAVFDISNDGTYGLVGIHYHSREGIHYADTIVGIVTGIRWLCRGFVVITDD